MAYSRRKKRCEMSAKKIGYVDYKDLELIKRYVTEKGKIISSRATGLCTAYQKKLAVAVKRARHMALLPFSAN